MKIVKILLAFMLVGVSIAASGCIFGAKTAATPETQTSTVQRGNITINITATGNLVYTDKEELAFEVGGTQQQPLSVEEVLVQEGDIVKKGDVLARLDASAWQDRLDTLENALTTAQRQQTTKERALTSAQRTLDTRQTALDAARRDVATKEMAKRQAELNLQTAQYNLEQIADVKTALRAADDAQNIFDLARAAYQNAIKNSDREADIDTLRISVLQAGLELNGWDADGDGKKDAWTGAKPMLESVLSGKDIRLTTDTKLEIATRQLEVDQKQKAVNDAQVAIDDAKTAIKTAQYAVDDTKNSMADSQTAVDDAKKSVTDAQKTLDDETAKKTEIVAPFDGFIISVKVAGGNAINKGQVACTIADPNKFESSVMVTEMDISKVKLDGDATVSVDSLSGLSFPAKVTHIAPTATVSQGVVNFKVLVELQSLQPIRNTQTSTSGQSRTFTPGQGQAAQVSASGQTPSGLQQAIESGRITQEQAQQFAQRMAQGAGEGSTTRAAAAPSANIQLREGLTVTVNILVDQRTSVLLVPSRAITRQGGKATVQVQKPDGSIEERTITTGISDYTNTEVISGLSEGELVVIPKPTTTTSTQSQQQAPRGLFMPGGPPPGR